MEKTKNLPQRVEGSLHTEVIVDSMLLITTIMLYWEKMREVTLVFGEQSAREQESGILSAFPALAAYHWLLLSTPLS